MTNDKATEQCDCPLRNGKRSCRVRGYKESLKHPSSMSKTTMRKIIKRLEPICRELKERGGD